MIENFDTKKAPDMAEVKMSVSAICHSEDNKKFAYVSFSDGVRTAEGKIPDCKIIDNKGFAQIEIEQLEHYMTDNLDQLKGLAANVNIFDAFIR